MASMALRLVEENPDFVLTQFQELRGFVRAQARIQPGLHTVEEGIEVRGRELCRLLLQEFVRLCGDGDVGLAIEVATVTPIRMEDRDGIVTDVGTLTASGVLLTHRRPRERKYLSVFGPIEIERLGYSQRGQSSVLPLDERLELPDRVYSYPIQQKLSTAVARGPFEEATQTVQEATGQQVATANAPGVVIDVAADFDEFYESRPVRPPEEAPPIQVAVADGKGVPMRERVEEAARHDFPEGEQRRGTKQQATVAAVYNIEPHMRTIDDIVKECSRAPLKVVPPRPRPQDKRVWASLQRTKEEVFASVAAEMLRRDPGHLKTWVCITDGEKALRRQARKALAALGPFILILDLFHVLEYLWAAANAFHGKNTDAAETWCTAQLRRLLAGEVSGVARGMKQSATKRHIRGSRRRDIDRTAAYFLANKDSMKYDEYIAAGLPIGSGVGEGTVRNLVKDRLERTGMHWTEDVAEAVLKVRALELSGDTQDYWPFHIQCEQARLTNGRTWSPAQLA